MNEECGNFVLLPLLSTLYYGTISYGMVRGNKCEEARLQKADDSLHLKRSYEVRRECSSFPPNLVCAASQFPAKLNPLLPFATTIPYIDIDTRHHDVAATAGPPPTTSHIVFNSRYVIIIIIEYYSLYPWRCSIHGRFAFAFVLGGRQWVFRRH